ncbi:TadE/TadG family type IV pilus assembly protein [Salipiger mucosus]|uniref:Uncharacterized protein n=1 Tax=Salipiger mucosus DSM 16094 TaxID=1123237 RepID=S9S0U1_9RHOB|nr:TadG family pilus assembly protein [Salipiger mucosus]EPX83855.1 hypothetical protein Salmuc_01630 [Salipiger mucosus DSM 16094]
MRSARFFIRRFCRDESGNMTILGVFLTLSSLTVGSLAVDFSRKEASHVDLQVLADATAHAALVSRQTMTAPEAIQAALAFSHKNATDAAVAIHAGDLEFGHWDPEARTFTVNALSKQAVRVTAHRTDARGNYVEGLLTHMLGIRGFEVEAETVLAGNPTLCSQNGLVAEDSVEMTSANAFGINYCIHSDHTIKMSIGNDFGAGSIVSLPDTADLQIPSGDVGSNPGLAEALTEMPPRLNINQIIEDFAVAVETGESEYIPAGVRYSWNNRTTVNGQLKLSPDMMMAGEMHVFDCGSGNGTLDLETGTYGDLVLWTNCKMKFGQGTAFENAVIVQRNAASQAISAPNGVRFGAVDNCAPSGDVLLVTEGGMQVASDLEMHGATLAAKGPVSFAAKPDGMNGASVISGSALKVTSSGAFGFCDAERAFPWKAFRMVL